MCSFALCWPSEILPMKSDVDPAVVEEDRGTADMYAQELVELHEGGQ